MVFSADAVIAQARSEIGYTESPPGSNRTKFAGEAGHANGQPWCATFCVAMARRCGGRFGDESAYTPSLYGSMAHVGDPRPGDLAFFDFPDSVHRIQHVGIVVSATGSTVTCVEGNTSSSSGGSQSNGGGVFERTRSRSVVVGFGRPSYGVAEEDDMTGDQAQQLADIHKYLFTGPTGQFPEGGVRHRLNDLWHYLFDGPGTWFPEGGVRHQLNTTIPGKLAEIESRIEQLERR